MNKLEEKFMKKNCIIFFIIIIMSINTYAYAQATDEISTEDMLKEITFICSNDIAKKYDVAFDYSIEIIKRKPSSMETYYSIFWMSNIDENENEVLKNKIKNLQDNYYSTIDNFDSDQAEKTLLLLFFLGKEANTLDEMKSLNNLMIKLLTNIQNSCTNEYKPLVVLLLSMLDKKNEIVHINYFKENFPSDPMLPFLDLNLVGSFLEDNETEKCIQVTNELITKYSNITTPYGWKITADFYNTLILCYIGLKDFDNANKYFNILKQIAPKYPQTDLIIGVLNTMNNK